MYRPEPNTMYLILFLFLLSKSFMALKNLLRKNSTFMKFYNAVSYDDDNVKIFSSLYEHERMLADKVRLDAYYRAIKKYVNKGDTVVELGTGTGILSLFASMEKPKKIYAIDHSKIIDVAKSISQHNRIDNIEFVNLNSRQFSIPEKADVIIQEQI